MPVEPQPQALYAERFYAFLKWLRGRVTFDLVQGVRYVSSDADATIIVRTRTHVIYVRYGTCARTFGLEEQLQLMVRHGTSRDVRYFTVAFAKELDLRSRCQLQRFIGSAAMLASRASADPRELALLQAPPLDLVLVSVPATHGVDPVTGVPFMRAVEI